MPLKQSCFFYYKAFVPSSTRHLNLLTARHNALSGKPKCSPTTYTSYSTPMLDRGQPRNAEGIV
ncbi:hypothetical protein KP79_PYT23660 [Mizuhopecten yessoensis]|uniref:Uncharacterized protein n=1 Tax=Mizuhopecten yessoensis TaxID=6573 RepID=A0A210PQV7_MIZYE|nr:hypothetical protein KP79_PYT23660 [Mizuhopecten yessoensis]